MACIRLSSKTNNQESQLFNTIYSKITNGNETLADEYFAFFQSDEFIEDFGDWISDYKKSLDAKEINQRKVDDNGQPKLFFDEIYNKYYYLNKSDNKTFFPQNPERLKDLYSNSSIRNITKILAFNFIKSRIGDNFNNLDLSTQVGSLSKSIRDKITSKSNQLKSSEDIMQNLEGDTLSQSLKYLPEWIKNVENYFRELKLVYKEETETEELEEEETSERGESYTKSSFEKSTKDNISSNVKLRLSLLVDNNNLDDLFYEPKFIEFDEVYSTLQKILPSQIAISKDGELEFLFDIYKQEIFNLITKKPYLKDLYNQLNNSSLDKNIKYEFVQAFNLDYNNFIGTMFSIDSVDITDENEKVIDTEYKVNFSVQNLSEVGAKNRFIKNNWHYHFVKKFSVDNSFNNESYNKIKKLSEKYDKLFIGFKKRFRDNEYTTPEELNKPIESLKSSILDELGITTTKDGFFHYLDGLQSDELSTENRAENLNELFDSIRYLFTSINNKEFNPIIQNPFDTQSEINKLAKAEAFYLSEGSDSSIFSAGKSKWVYSYPSYLSTKLKEWKKDRTILLKHYLSTPYNQGSYYMKYLLALDGKYSNPEQISEERISRFDLNIFNSLQETGDASNAVDNKTMSKNDAYADIMNKLLGFRVGRKSYFSTPTPADKSTQYQFTIDNEAFINTNARYRDGKVDFNEEAKEIIFQFVKSEHERIKQVQSDLDFARDTEDSSKLRVHYHLGNRNGLKFQLFPSLNYETFDNKKQGFSLYDENSRVLQDINLDSIRDNILDLITNTVGEEIMRTYQHMRDVGLIQINRFGNYISKGIDSEIWNSYGNSNIVGLKIASDVYINGLISQVEYSKMFSGDVAYYKNMVDYKKRIPATYTDGLQLMLRNNEQFFNAAIIDGVNIATPYLNELKDIVPESVWKHYKNINSTDAQAWITLDRWKFLKVRLGKWGNEYDVIYDKITGQNNEPLSVKELKKVAQPLKGVYFEINDGVPVYLKYSQAVLLPNIVNNNPQLRKLLDKMEDAGVDELITIDGIKVGANEPVKTNDNNGNVLSDFTLNPIKLKNNGWKLQQDLPTKTFKQTSLGSQIQKNIFSGLAFNRDETFNVEGKVKTGNEMIDYINDIVRNLSDRGLDDLNNEFGITPDFKISNIARLNSALIEELKARRASNNVIEALEAGVSSYGIPGYQQKIQNIFASIVTDRIVKVKTNGGSFIQMSNYGFSKSEADEKGVKWTPWAEETTQEYQILRDENDKEIIGPNGKPLIRPAGILLSGSFIAKYIPNYQEFSSEELFGTYNKETHKYEGGKVDYDILNNIIGYRIPNQGLASNDALQIVGILPSEVGDTVVAYTGIPTKTGSDFDIDKMYMMIPNFKPSYTKSTINKAINWIKNELQLSKEDLEVELKSRGYKYINFDNYNSMLELFAEDVLLNPRSNDSLKDEFENAIGIGSVSKLSYVKSNKPLSELSKDELGNKLIEAYKAVILNPNVISNIMTPIDFDFIKDDIVNMFPIIVGKDLYDFNIIDDIALKYEFIAGKAGVGQTANSLVDHVRGNMAKLGFFKYYLGIGKEYPNGDTKFDEEYSEELSDKDIKDYIKEYNKKAKLTNSKLISESQVKSLKKIKISHTLSALMNAYVDIAKDPYITRGNWTTQTANTGFMLIRAGVHSFYVNAILGQPIIKEYINFVTNSESKIVKDTGDLEDKFLEKKINDELSNKQLTLNGITRNYSYLKDLIDQDSKSGFRKAFKLESMNEESNILEESVIGDITEILQIYSPDSTKTDSFNYSLNNLREQIDDSTPQDQINIFKWFREWQNQSKKLNDNIVASKTDVNGYGKNITSLIVIDNLINKLINNQYSKEGNFTGFNTKLIQDDKLTLLGSYKKNSIDYIKKVMEANPLTFLVANRNIINTFNEISKGITGGVLINDRLASKLENSYYSYFMSGFKPFSMAIEEKINLLDNLPSRVAAAKGKDNLFIDELDLNSGFISMSNRKKSISYETELVDSWADLLDENPELGEDLIKYSYLTSGLQMNIRQFYSYIPYEWFVNNNINDYINQYSLDIGKSETIDTKFIDQFFRHSVEDYQVVPRISTLKISDQYKNNIAGFILSDKGRGNLFVKKTFNTIDGIKFALFKLEGYTEDERAIYTRRIALGNTDNKGYKIYEYDVQNDVVPTFIESNMVKGLTNEARQKFKDMVKFDENHFNNSIKYETNNDIVDNVKDSDDPFLKDCE